MHEDIIRRAIPSSGELIPAIGLGTWRTFDVDASKNARATLGEVLRRFVALGGTVIDTSPMYGRSEAMVGRLTSELGLRSRLFLATKVWVRGREAGIGQMQESMRRLRAGTIDLMQVHNLLDADTHLATLAEWKKSGRVRYIGVTHYRSDAYDELERTLSRHAVDFVQLNYSLEEREADHRILSFARDHGVAVLINRPFAADSMFRRVRGRALPDFAAGLDIRSWPQFFLAWIVSHPAVTCAIPATADPAHLEEDMGTLHGRLPDAAMRERMARAYDALV